METFIHLLKHGAILGSRFVGAEVFDTFDREGRHVAAYPAMSPSAHLTAFVDSIVEENWPWTPEQRRQ